MFIGGGKLVELSLWEDESLLRESQHDVEEISQYGESLNPFNLFLRGSTFELGRLFLTDQRLILLPYNKHEVERAQLLQKVGHKILDKVGLGIPRPKINFTQDPLIVELGNIHSLDPYRRQFGIHPTLSLAAYDSNYRFKFLPGESPK